MKFEVVIALCYTLLLVLLKLKETNISNTTDIICLQI